MVQYTRPMLNCTGLAVQGCFWLTDKMDPFHGISKKGSQTTVLPYTSCFQEGTFSENVESPFMRYPNDCALIVSAHLLAMLS